ncbi:MAG: PTS transporter subunit EIIC [Bacteroidales bacterium]|nr:PTS transporter subunit EIIC [Bacteroidales bacterium]
MMKYLQRLGKSLMLPVACLPVAGILLGIGYWLESSLGSNIPATFLLQAGGAILNHIPLLFAIGVSVGMADESKGAAALAGLVSWLVIITLLSPVSVAKLSGSVADPAFDKIENVFTGIISGLLGAFCYNRFKNTQLPDALAFFGGKRSVPIVAAGLACIVSILLFFSWPLMYNGLILFGKSILDTGAVGVGLYAFFNRLLIPLGLHHALNQVFWFDVAGINDLADFWSGQGVLGVSGQYMTGFFPVMMFGLPAAALAMYHTAKPERKKAVGGLMLASALSAFLTGVTEPLEFSFMFLAPGLYALHALLTGLTAGVMAYLPVRAGFNFSAGLVDYVLSFKSPMALNPLWILWIGLITALVYYLVFRFTIQFFRLRTPGREEDDQNSLPGRKEQSQKTRMYRIIQTSDSLRADKKNNRDSKSAKNTTIRKSKNSDNYREVAVLLIQGLGGKENIAELDNCISRLRIVLRQDEAVDDTILRSAAIAGIIRPGKNTIQLIVGPKVQFLAKEMKNLLNT